MQAQLIILILIVFLAQTVSRGTLSGRVTVGGSAAAFGLLNNGSCYVPVNYTTFTPPAKGSTYVDSHFGTTVKRMSDGQTDFASDSAHHDLHSTNVTNYKEDLLLILDGAGDYLIVQVADPSTVVRDRTATSINNNEEAKWAGRTDEIYYTEVGTNVLKKYNVTTDTHSVVHTFTGYTHINLGEGEGDVSEDGDHIPISAGGTNGVEDVFLYKISTDELGPVIETGEIVTSEIVSFSGNTIQIGSYQNGYTWSSYQTSGGRSMMRIFLNGSTNRGYAQITSKPDDQLNGAIDASVTTITVDSTTGFLTAGKIQIDSEIISYTGTNATQFTGCTRGVDSTTAASHSDNAIVNSNQLTASGGLPAGTAIGDKVGLVKGFDQVHCTPDNRILIGYYQPNASGNTGYDATGSQLYTKAGVRVALSPAIQALYHCDIGRDTDGSEIQLQEADSDYTPATGSGGGLQKQNLNTGAKTALVNMGYFTSKHPSMSSAGVWPWAVVDPVDSDFVGSPGRTATLPAPGSGLAADWDTVTTNWCRNGENWNEITIVKLDGSEVRHLVHHRSRLDSGLYWATPRPTWTQRGTYIVFDSNMALQPVADYTDVYLVQVKAVTTDFTDPTFNTISSGTPGSTTATITYNTNEAGTTQLEFGPTTFYANGCSAFSVTLTTSHTVNLTGLTANTVYNYRLKSRDAAGNIGLSTNQTFQTAP